MARIFSVSFQHDEHSYNAMVAVRTTPFFTEYTINIFDEALALRLPNNKMISTENQRFLFTDSAAENDPQLMDSIIRAVSYHVHSLQS